MARPVILFAGQWADLLACWGAHFEVAKALEVDCYVERQREILGRNGPECSALGIHLVGRLSASREDAGMHRVHGARGSAASDAAFGRE